MDRISQMLELQKPLYDWFGIYKAGLPNYPVDIESKTGQKTIKDFISNATEELSEAHEQYQFMYTAFNANLSTPLEHEVCMLEEFADVVHFFMNIFLCCNINGVKIDNYYIEDYGEWDVIDGEDNLDFGYRVADEQESAYSISFGAKYTTVSYTRVITQASLMWDVTHQLYKAANLLKIRDWREIEGVNANDFNKSILKAWQAFMNLLKFMAITPELIIQAHKEKNDINLQRIKAQKENEQNP